MKELVKRAFLRSWSPAEKSLLLTDVLLFGVLVGWITTPLWKLAARKDMFYDVKIEKEEEDEEEE